MIKDVALAFKNGWKIFLLSLIAQFIVASLLYFGAKSPAILDFLLLPNIQQEAATLVTPLVKEDIFGAINTKLKQKPNTFQIKRIPSTEFKVSSSEQGLVPVAYVSSGYEQAAAYLVVDLDSGEVLAEKNAFQRLPIASLTKIMTAVVALDLASAKENFRVSEEAASVQPTSIGVIPNQKMALEELLNALLLTSANDSAEVIKEGIDKKFGQEVFIKAMNEKAVILGLKNTHFENPQGYDGKSHYSSAEDLAILSHYALTNYPEISEIVKKEYAYLPENLDHKQFDLYNWNGLLGVYPGVYGVKIGNTENAGHTTSVVAERDGKKVLVVLLGAPGVLQRDLWAAQLLDLGFEKLGGGAAYITEAELEAKYATWKYWN